MITSEIKVAWRSLRKNRVYSLISLFGLAFGMSCRLLLFFWIRDELSFDRFHAKADRIYRVEYADYGDGNEVRSARNGFQVSYQNRRFTETIVFADPEVCAV
jgi:putative ABC transport system permease protein